MTATADAPHLEDRDTPAEVLAAVRADKAIANAAEVRMFRNAAEWAVMHPAESIDQAATVDGTQGELAIAGPGAPLVAEFCVAELAAALGLTTGSGQRYLGDAVETRYRLPKLWKRVMAGEVLVWKARKIAQATLSLPAEGAAYVDTHLAPTAHRLTFAQIDRTVEAARTRFDPAAAEARRQAAMEGRHFDVHAEQVSFDGTVHVDGELDLADALDLDEAVARGAQQLADLGCVESLDVRRAMALGQLARTQTALDLQTEADETGPEPVVSRVAGSHLNHRHGGPVRKPRQLVLHVHVGLADGAVASIGGLENTRTLVSMDQVRDWCAHPDTEVRVQPVLDLGAYLYTDAYQPTATIREQVTGIVASCAFPNCDRPSRCCELDHIIPWRPGGRGGPTATWNLAPLCRRHHRLKTHGGWCYVRTGATTFTWTSPLGLTYHVDTRPASFDDPDRHTG